MTEKLYINFKKTMIEKLYKHIRKDGNKTAGFWNHYNAGAGIQILANSYYIVAVPVDGVINTENAPVTNGKKAFPDVFNRILDAETTATYREEFHTDIDAKTIKTMIRAEMDRIKAEPATLANRGKKRYLYRFSDACAVNAEYLFNILQAIGEPSRIVAYADGKRKNNDCVRVPIHIYGKHGHAILLPVNITNVNDGKTGVYTIYC